MKDGRKEGSKDKTYEVYEGRTGTKAGREEGRKKGR
jgi:hypothetical protein